MVRKNLNKIFTSLFFLMVGGYVLFETGTRFKNAGMADGNALRNTALYPRIIATSLLILTFFYLGKTIIDYRKKRQEQVEDETLTKEGRKKILIDKLSAFGCLAWVYGYVTVFDMLGFLTATPIMMIGLLGFLGVRKPIVNLSYAIGGTCLVFLFFQEFLDIPLPVGILGFLYE